MDDNDRIIERRSPVFSAGVILTLLLLFVGSIFTVTGASAQQACTDPWIVQVDDTLSEIAAACGTTVDALLAANPNIQDPQSIYPGLRVDIPDQATIPDTGAPSLNLSPAAGPAGTIIRVTGSGFPANATINVGPGVQGSEPVSITQVRTDTNGRFSTQVTIPADANAGRTWVVLAATEGQGPSALGTFTVTTAAQNNAETYVVQQGDTLSEIAARFGTTTNALVRANPQINDPSLIFSGQTLILPGSLAVIPDTGRRVYVVEQGDTLSGIAAEFGTTVNDLLQANPGIENPRLIYRGQRITIPEPVNVIPDTGAVVYTIQPGDTLSEIAVQFNTTVEALMNANPQIEDASLIYTGNQITIPQ